MKVSIHKAFLITGIVIGLLLATVLGIYAQDFSYYLNDRYPTIELTTAITIFTFLSIGLYVMIPLLLLIFKKLNPIYLIACFLIGLPISLWSFFVWAMWMG
ncbi:hypothetical protein M3152_16545 [Sporosarcina luteola]|uniref:hypothetical protein n=1 Tax=Bacillales TaxID=1385 RepID=UPI0020406827|nr:MULTISPECIES: hypothetical protein [Bacillales]MCM3639311.1 hypothetical protein [Sporosarcina luteola]